jgi:hypothetical protein
MLQSLEEQVLEQAAKANDFAGVNLMIYNTRPGKHPVFEKNKELFRGHGFISFKELDAEWKDPSDFEPDNMNNPNDIPGAEVRRQTFDYINMLGECAAGGISPDHPESFVVILEDDFIPCPYAIDEMHRVLEHLAECSQTGYSSISFSKGMNAIAIPVSKISKLIKYLEEKITVLPPDLLIYQAWDKVSDVHFANDLFTHLGWFSSFEFRNQLNFGKKYNRMRGAGEKCYASRQRYSGKRHRNIGAFPLSSVLSTHTRSSHMTSCSDYKSSFEWHRPTSIITDSTGKSQSQHKRYDYWLEQAKQELPGVASLNI